MEPLFTVCCGVKLNLWSICLLLFLTGIDQSIADTVDMDVSSDFTSAWENNCVGGYHDTQNFFCNGEIVIPEEHYNDHNGYWAKCSAESVLICTLVYHPAIDNFTNLSQLTIEGYFKGTSVIQLVIQTIIGYSSQQLEGNGWETIPISLSSFAEILDIRFTVEDHEEGFTVIDKISITNDEIITTTTMASSTDSETTETGDTSRTTETENSSGTTETGTTKPTDTTGTTSRTTETGDTTKTTDTTSGPTDTTSGITETTSGITETTSGPTETTSGPTDTTSGITETTFGPTETTSGPTDTTSGITETTFGPTDTTSGSTEIGDTTGTDEGTTETRSTSTTVTHGTTSQASSTTETDHTKTATSSIPNQSTTLGRTSPTTEESQTTSETSPNTSRDPDITTSVSYTNPTKSTTEQLTSIGDETSSSTGIIPNPETTVLPVAGTSKTNSYFIPVLIAVITSLLLLALLQCCIAWFRIADKKKKDEDSSTRTDESMPYQRFRNEPVGAVYGYSPYHAASLSTSVGPTTTRIAYNFNPKPEIKRGYSTGQSSLPPMSPTSPTGLIEPIYSKAERSDRSSVYGYGMDPNQEYFPRLAKRNTNYDMSPV